MNLVDSLRSGGSTLADAIRKGIPLEQWQIPEDGRQ